MHNNILRRYHICIRFKIRHIAVSVDLREIVFDTESQLSEINLITGDFTVFSTAFKLYQNEGRMGDF